MHIPFFRVKLIMENIKTKKRLINLFDFGVIMPLPPDSKLPVSVSLPPEQRRQLFDYQIRTGAGASGVVQLALREFFEKRQQVKEIA